MEKCGDGEEILIILKDMHKAVYDMEIIEKIQRSHAKVKDVNPNILPLRSGRLIIGSCDACRYIHKGYKAAVIMGTEKGRNKAPHWHSPEDTPENIKREVLKDFLEICLEFVDMVDKEFD